MPTYVYECETCEKVFETEQRVSEDPLKDCACGGKGTLKRLIQPAAVMFKGAGFYVTDSQDKSDAPTESCEPDCACSPSSEDD